MYARNLKRKSQILTGLFLDEKAPRGEYGKIRLVASTGACNSDDLEIRHKPPSRRSTPTGDNMTVAGGWLSRDPVEPCYYDGSSCYYGAGFLTPIVGTPFSGLSTTSSTHSPRYRATENSDSDPESLHPFIWFIYLLLKPS